MATLIEADQDKPHAGPPGSEWWHPEEVALLGRIELETIRSFGQVLLAQGYTPEEGRVAIEQYMLQKQQREREQHHEQVAKTTGEALPPTSPELEALRSFEAQLVAHGHTPEQVRQITAPLSALTGDRSIDVAEAEDAALRSIQAFTAMHVAAQAPAPEPVEDEYQAAQRAKSAVEANAERLCEKARSLHVKWKESEVKAKEAQARVVEEERLQQIQRKRNKKTRRRARKTMDAINAQRYADDRQLVPSAAEPDSESEPESEAGARAEALARSFLAEVESERDAESAAAAKLQARWRGRTFRRQAQEWRDKQLLDHWEAINDRKRKAATRNRMRALADDLRSDIYHSPTVETVHLEGAMQSFFEPMVNMEMAARARAATCFQAHWRGRTLRRQAPQEGVCVGIDGIHRPATFFQGRALPKSSSTIAAERAAEQRQRVREEAARAKKAKKERRRARATSEADAAEALRVECEARRAARQRQAAHERDQERATFMAEPGERESEDAPHEDAPHEDEDCAGDLEFANQMERALQLSAEEACLREKFNTYDAVAGELAFDPVEDPAPPLEEERSAAECVVCWNEATHIVIPCGHFCLCANCVPKDLDKCPICRGAMAQVVKVFVS